MRNNPHSFISDSWADGFLLLSVAVLALNCVSQIVAFPLQAALVIYAVRKMDIKLVPGLYLLLLDAAYFSFLGVRGYLKFSFIISFSVSNVFLMTVFFVVLWQLARHCYDRRSMSFVPLWFCTAIPAVWMAVVGRRAGALATWQIPLIFFMVPAFYYWGISIGRTWYAGRDYFICRILFIFAIKTVLELLRLFYMGCQFQGHVIAACFGLAVLVMRGRKVMKSVGLLSIAAAFAVTIFAGYLKKLDLTGEADETAMVSTFSLLAVLLLGVGLAVAVGRFFQAGLLRAFPYLALAFCSFVLVYAVLRANTTDESKIVTTHFSGASMKDRFEAKLVGDRGSVWARAVREELFRRPLLIRRLADVYVWDPIKHVSSARLLPHNQFLTLVCRYGWWQGFLMILFLWWLHVRSFNVAARMYDDRVTLMVLLAPSAAVFVVVGLTGQNVFTPTWNTNSMATLTFPGILYGAYLVRQRVIKLTGRAP